MITTFAYRKAIQILQTGAGNTIPENTQAAALKAAQAQNWLTSLFEILAKTLIEAESILFRDGLYRKPNFWRFVALGKVALNLILAIIKLLKNV